MLIDGNLMHYQALNAKIRDSEDRDIEVIHLLGQRYIASGLSGKNLTLRGTPGNALGSYLDGCTLEVFGNAQDGLGDTMNSGEIIVHGRCGDAAGYAMRGGRILIQGDAGYRAGIHMKAYRDKVPVLVVGGRAGSFLGEYQAGGIIIVLGLGCAGPPVGDFCASGMHGGAIFLRTSALPKLPAQVNVRSASAKDMAGIRPHLDAFARAFAVRPSALQGEYAVLTPETANPYRQLYTLN